MRYARLFILLLLLSASHFASELGQGSICLPALPGLSATITEPAMTPPGLYISPGSTLLIQVDK